MPSTRCGARISSLLPAVRDSRAGEFAERLEGAGEHLRHQGPARQRDDPQVPQLDTDPADAPKNEQMHHPLAAMSARSTWFVRRWHQPGDAVRQQSRARRSRDGRRRSSRQSRRRSHPRLPRIQGEMHTISSEWLTSAPVGAAASRHRAAQPTREMPPGGPPRAPQSMPRQVHDAAARP